MKKFVLCLFIFLALHIVFVYACPICSATLGTAAVSANYFGMDVSIFGIFIGAFSIPTGQWFSSFIKERNFKTHPSLIVFVSFLTNVLSILLFDPGGSIFYRIYWYAKILIGCVAGALITLLAFWIHKKIIQKKKRTFFKFQRLAITLSLLIITSLVLYWILTGNSALNNMLYLDSYSFYLLS